MELLSGLWLQAKDWCVGKQWWWRSLILVWFGFVLVGYLKTPADYCVFDSLNLGIHELGHMIFGWAPQFLAIAGGTFTQLAAPLFGMWNFYKQNDFFAIVLCFGWLSTNLFGVANYAADARAMVLDLVSPFGGDTVIHDWNYMLSSTGLLAQDTLIASLIRISAIASMLVCLSAGSWMLWRMLMNRNPIEHQ